MINCPQCGADNMVGAIFCRTCGAKLDLDAMRPESFQEQGETTVKKVGKTVLRICTLAIFFVLLGFLVALFLPTKGTISGDLDKKAMSRVTVMYKWMQRPSKKYHVFRFTSEESTALLNEVLSFPGSGALTPTHLSVEFLEDENVRLVLKSLLFNAVPIQASLIGAFEVTENGIEFSAVSAKAGKLPLPTSMQALVLSKFNSLIADNKEFDIVRKKVKHKEVNNAPRRISVRYL